MAQSLHISISAEKIAQIGGLEISNSMFTSIIVSCLIIFLAIYVRLQIKKTSQPKGWQNVFEWIIESLLGLVNGVTNNKQKTKEFFPFIATFFLFITLNNWFGLLPGVGTIGFTEKAANEEEELVLIPQAQAIAHEDEAEEKIILEAISESVEERADQHSKIDTNLPAQETQEETKHVATEETHHKFVPYLRAATADLNTTIALGIISIFLVQAFGFKHLGLSYLKKYFNFSNPIMFFVGLLELVSEFAKIISFAFRLFGNIFAGEVLLAVIGFLVGIILPMPFYGLEIFVGFIQALVFSMLSLVFFNMATISHEDH